MIIAIISLAIGATLGYITAAIMATSHRAEEQEETPKVSIKGYELKEFRARQVVPFEDFSDAIRFIPTSRVNENITNNLVMQLSDELAQHVKCDTDPKHREYTFSLRMWVEP